MTTPIARTILVTGANGYVGSFIVTALRAAGYRVLLGGRFPGADVLIDLDKPELTEQQTFSEPVFACIHGAAANEVACRQDPYRSIAQNVLGTRALLAACVRQGVERFVYLSTWMVFGTPTDVLEEDTVARPIDDYGLSHWQAEEYVDAYSRNGRVVGTSVRLSNVFGLPPDWTSFSRWTLAPFDFCRQAVRDRKIVLRSSGRQKRDFITGAYVGQQIVDLLSGTPHPRLNLAGSHTSILDWAERVKEIASPMLGRDVEVSVGPAETSQEPDFVFRSRHIARDDGNASRDKFIVGTLRHLMSKA